MSNQLEVLAGFVAGGMIVALIGSAATNAKAEKSEREKSEQINQEPNCESTEEMVANFSSTEAALIWRYIHEEKFSWSRLNPAESIDQVLYRCKAPEIGVALSR